MTLILSHCRLAGRIPQQIVMVIQIFISLAQGVDSLPQQRMFKPLCQPGPQVDVTADADPVTEVNRHLR